MTKTTLILSVALLSCLLAALSCWPGTQRAEFQSVSLWPAPVKVTGVDECADYSLGYARWVTTPLKDNPGGLLVREGDLLCMENEQKKTGGGQNAEKQKGDSFFFPYEQRDGSDLDFKIQKCTLSLNGKTVSLSVSAEDGGWEWFETASENDLSALRLLYLEETEIAPAHIPALKKLARSNPHIGLVIEHKAALRTVLPLFDPRNLVIGENGPPALDGDDVAMLASCKNLEALWLNADGIKSLDFLTHLPHLRVFILGDWDPDQTGNFLPRCHGLKSLTLADFKGKDLSCVRDLPGLQQLDLAGGDSLADLSALSDLPQLQILNVFTDKEKMDLSVLEKCGKLCWLGFSGVSQEQFAQTIARVPRLHGLALIAGEEVKDLSPLKRLPELRDLVLVGKEQGEPLLAPLREMKDLRFLVLQSDYFEENAGGGSETPGGPAGVLDRSGQASVPRVRLDPSSTARRRGVLVCDEAGTRGSRVNSPSLPLRVAYEQAGPGGRRPRGGDCGGRHVPVRAVRALGFAASTPGRVRVGRSAFRHQPLDENGTVYGRAVRVFALHMESRRVRRLRARPGRRNGRPLPMEFGTQCPSSRAREFRAGRRLHRHRGGGPVSRIHSRPPGSPWGRAGCGRGRCVSYRLQVHPFRAAASGRPFGRAEGCPEPARMGRADRHRVPGLLYVPGRAGVWSAPAVFAQRRSTARRARRI